jgi:2-hydroxychromene-2-carboxylate isomerase
MITVRAKPMQNALSWSTATSSALPAGKLRRLSGGFRTTLGLICSLCSAIFRSARSIQTPNTRRKRQNQATLEDQHLLAFAGHLCLSEDELREALHAETYQPWVAVDFRGGVHSGVNGTPTFFLNGQRHDGAFDFETLAVRIQQQIETAGRNK